MLPETNSAYSATYGPFASATSNTIITSVTASVHTNWPLDYARHLIHIDDLRARADARYNKSFAEVIDELRRLHVKRRRFPSYPFRPYAFAPPLPPQTTVLQHFVHRLRAASPGRWLAGSGRRASGRYRPKRSRIMEL